MSEVLTGPARTCVGCRKRDSASNLVRWVARDGNVVLDLRRNEPGRGAWLHPSGQCLEQAIRRRAFVRALRGPADASNAADQLRLAGNHTGHSWPRTP